MYLILVRFLISSKLTQILAWVLRNTQLQFGRKIVRYIRKAVNFIVDRKLIKTHGMSLVLVRFLICPKLTQMLVGVVRNTLLKFE